MHIIRATREHLDGLAGLFDAYRVFYGQPSDVAAAEQFLAARLGRQDSCIFVAIADIAPIGFAQLYPSFSSVSIKPIWILNDLYVAASQRGQGIARELMEAAEQFARESGAVRVVLSTQIANHVAQNLYESRGYIRDTEFYHYALGFE
ncbi:MAG: GNAT family N-acetyltransferase [Cyanobacteria bacterium J06639_1]